MKALLLSLSLLMPATAVAQTFAPPALPGVLAFPDQRPFETMVRSYGELRSSNETPAMQRQKLKRAIALREEARQLQEADGGTLSPASLRYLQRKADAIMAGRF